MIAQETRMRLLRRQLDNPKVTQEALARKAGVSVQWLRRLESYNQPTSYSTARKLLTAINRERLARGFAEIELDEMNLTIV